MGGWRQKPFKDILKQSKFILSPKLSKKHIWFLKLSVKHFLTVWSATSFKFYCFWVGYILRKKLLWTWSQLKQFWQTKIYFEDLNWMFVLSKKHYLYNVYIPFGKSFRHLARKTTQVRCLIKLYIKQKNSRKI